MLCSIWIDPVTFSFLWIDNIANRYNPLRNTQAISSHTQVVNIAYFFDFPFEVVSDKSKQHKYEEETSQELLMLSPVTF